MARQTFCLILLKARSSWLCRPSVPIILSEFSAKRRSRQHVCASQHGFPLGALVELNRASHAAFLRHLYQQDLVGDEGVLSGYAYRIQLMKPLMIAQMPTAHVSQRAGRLSR